MKIMRSSIKASKEEVLLEVNIVSRLTFTERVACICSYASFPLVDFFRTNGLFRR